MKKAVATLLLVISTSSWANILIYNPSDGGRQQICVYQQGVLTCL